MTQEHSVWRGPNGVKMSADCYRIINGERFVSWFVCDPAMGPAREAYRAAGIKFRTLRGDELLIREQDADRARAIDAALAKEPSHAPREQEGEARQADAVGAVEQGVGRWVYRRIERLTDAKPGTPEAAELLFLSAVAEHVEEYGEEACADHALAAPAPASGEALRAVRYAIAWMEDPNWSASHYVEGSGIYADRDRVLAALRGSLAEVEEGA